MSINENNKTPQSYITKYIIRFPMLYSFFDQLHKQDIFKTLRSHILLKYIKPCKWPNELLFINLHIRLGMEKSCESCFFKIKIFIKSTTSR